MKKFLPNQILTRTLLLGLVFLFLGLSESFGQTITLDGNLNPYDEYASGATQLYDPTIGSTCAVDQVWASFDIPDETIYLLFNVGNGGSAIFRLYFDIDGNSTTGLIVDTEITDNNGEYVNAYGADRVIEVNSGKANQITYYSYTTQTDGSVLREEIPHSIEGKSGFIYDEFGNQIGNSMEFAIPFSDFDYQPCDNIGEFINVGSYAAVKGGNINADFCNAVPLDFEIGAGGNISPELETICPGTTSPEMVLSGEQGTIVGWQQRLVNGPEFEDYNPLTQNVIPDTEGDHTYQIVLFESTEFRAVIQIGAELCEGEVAYLYSSSATITVAPQPNIEVQDLTECENSVGGNQAQFDLTSAVTWDIGTPAYSSNGTTITSPENYTGTDNEVITFTVTSDDECVTTETFTLQVDPKPSCSITGDLSICPSSTGNIYSGSDEDGMTYSWSISGGATINGSSTGQTVLVDANGICGGSFILELTTTKNGCSSTCSIEVVVQDTTPPAIVETAMEDLTVECADDWSAELAAWLENNAGATASDLCGEVTWSNNYDTQTLTDECGATGQLTVTFTATDECDNTSTTTAVFKIEDTTPPAIVETAMEDLTVECADDWSAELAAWLENNAGATASDLCGEVTWSNNYDTQTLTDECGATGQLTVTFTATDECDNTSTTTAVFKIEDTTPPAIVETAMEDLTVECADDWSAELAAWLENNAGATASDLCGEVTWSNNYDTQTLTDECGATGQLTVTFTATDECDNTSTTTAVFKIEDTTPPAIVETAMEDLTVECADDWSAELAAWLENNAGATASDLCGEVTWSNNYDTQTLTDECGATGQLTVTFTATDECDNTSTTTAVFKIEDTTPPAIVETAMEDLTVECADDWSAELAAWLENNAGATASDLCGEVTWSNNYDTQTLTDECGATGQLTVTFTATDECDNTSTTTAVFKIEDTTPPAIVETAMEDLTVECADDWSAELAAWLENNAGATASDLCGEVTWSNNYDTQTLTDECGATGQLTVTFTATDECDNTSTTTAVFKIEDTTPPAIVETAMEDLTVECADDWSAELAAWLENNAGATASDLCGEVTWSNNYDTQTLTDECGATGQLTVTFTATDECDNTSTTTAVFKIEDTTPPAIVETAMEDLTVECADDWSAELAAWLENNAGATASDLCGEVTWSNNYDTQTLTDECGATGQLTVTFTATDECDNTSTTTAVFKIEDTTPPAIVETAMEDLTVECADDWSAELAAWLENNAGATASDLCGEVTWSNNYDTQTLTDECGATGQLTVTFTATDECDNTSTTTAVFKIEDTTPPAIVETAMEDLTVECADDWSAELAAWLENNAGATASDLCGEVTWSNNYDTQTLTDECGATGQLTVTFTATDECDNTSTTTAVFKIEDTTDPTIDNTNLTNINIECGIDPANKLSDWLANHAGATATDNCGDVTWSNNYGEDENIQCDGGAITVIFTATDACGNESTTSASYSIQDNTAPAFNETLPQAETTAECDDVAEAVVLTAADNCDIDVPVVFTETRTDGDCANSYTLTRTWTATDDCDNETSFTQTVIVSDNTAPTFNETLPTAEITAECDNVVEAVVLTAADNCDTDVPVVFTEIRTDGDCANSYTLTRTWKATDDCGNETSHTQTVIVSDNTAPTFNETLPTAEITAECDNVVEPDVLTAADNCDTDVPVVFTETRTDGDCANSYTLTRTWKATDDCGNETSFTQTVIVSDNTAPTFNETLPTAEITAECDNVVEAVVLTAADNCDTDVPVVFTETRTDGDCANSYTLTRTWTATDDCGNETSFTQTVIVSDNTAPTFNETLPTAEITAECDNVVEAVVLTAADNCDTDVPVVFTETRTDGDCANSYTLTRTWTATDDCGNETSHTQTVTVSDNTAPTFNETLPTAEITTECDNVVEADVLTAADNCDTDVPVVFTETRTDGDCANSYTLTRTWTATDDCGNETSFTQTVTVSDNTAPAFNETLPTAEITAECDNVVEAVVLTAADNCDTDVPVVFTETRTDGDCANSYTLTRTWTATDDCGNETSHTQTVTVSDNTAPTFNETLPTAEITAECDNFVEAVVLTAADNCDTDVQVVFTETRTDGDCANSYTLTRTWTATDDCDNESSFTQTVIVSDNTAPTFNETLPTAEITAECDNVVEAIVLTAADNCDSDVPVVFTETKTDGDCANSYTLTRTWTATDDCGNATSHTQTVTVSDNTAPTFNETLPTAEITTECDNVVEAVVLTAADNCDSDVPVVFTETRTDGDCANSYTLIRTWTATDDCGNATSFTQTVVVSDNTAPEVTCNDITIQLDANGVATITVDDINGGATDACGSIATMFISQETFNCDNVGENQVTLTAIDECGNEATCTATVTVEEGDADCGFDPFKANDDMLTLVFCPNGTVSGDLDLFANDEGFTRENVSFTILTDLPEGVSVTDGNLLYANEDPTEAVITFTYSVCHTVNTENCDTAEVTIQVLVDTDCDGVPDLDDLDDDDDGILDIIEEENALDQTSLDSDGDGIVDRLDIDSDNDGIVDNIEWQSTIAEDGEYDYIFPLGTDSNNDGWDDAYDPSSNGITYEPWDMDLDGTPDYLDTNTDNEGEDDIVEGWDEFPNDSIADVSYIGSDADGDGLDDAYDTYNTTTEEWVPGQNAIGSDAYLQDTDDDGVRDWRDAVDDRPVPEQFACGEPVIPNAFSPNQDGYNDYFKMMIYCTGDQGGSEERVLGDDYTDARIEIFNRWGNLVYEQERYGNEDYWGDVDAWWDGRSMHDMQVGDDQLPTATYYYILYFNDGSKEPITGFIFLNN